MTITPTKPTRAQANASPTTEDLVHHRQKIGKIGGLIGDREQGPISIAWQIIVLSLIGILAIVLIPHKSDMPDSEIIKLLGGLIISALTFLGGYVSGKSK